MKRLGLILVFLAAMFIVAASLSQTQSVSATSITQKPPMYAVDPRNKVIVVITYYPGEASHPSYYGGNQIFVTGNALKQHHLSLRQDGDKVHVTAVQGFPAKVKYPSIYFIAKDIPTVNGVKWYPIGDIVQQLLPGYVVSVVPAEAIAQIANTGR